MRAPSAQRVFTPDFPLDLARVLGPLRRGHADPAFRRDEAGRTWLAANTAAGSGTLALHRRGAEVVGEAWGPGAPVLLDGLPALVGSQDDDSGFRAHHPLVADLRRRTPSLRLGSTGRIWDLLVPSILEQKVTGHEARRSWRELCRRFGEPAPGPVPAGLRVPPTPRAVLAITDWEWHQAGVDLSRRRAIVAAALAADRLERAARLTGRAGRDLLRTVPGVGFWTAAEVAQRAWGDADAISVGDFHIPRIVGHALLGRDLDDAGMLEVLAPYAPHRHRVVRYLETAGIARPRFGPRLAPRDYRSL
ncbi:DNA-3-methyladenine glycosylase family protein [Actinophytocola sediminis]